MKKSRISIDLETLGTNVDSQILSIGACVFDLSGNIHATTELVVQLPKDTHLNVTAGTLDFWLNQAKENPEAVIDAFDQTNNQTLGTCLCDLQRFVMHYDADEIWANGTKFDLGMLEHQFKTHNLAVPWTHNADRCMRTLRAVVGNLEVDYEGTAHNALHDAIWQAKYIAQALTTLGVTE